MRLFVAIRPPAAACEELAASLACPVDPRWHVTLAFLGERRHPATLVPDLREVAGRHPAMTLSLRGGGTFGGRVLWAGLAGDVDQLASLAEDVGRALEVSGDRPFRPHVTVKRGQGLVTPPGLAGWEGVAWRATELLLVSSVLGNRTVHEVLARCALSAR